jgi:hypothetical protein
MGDDIAGFWGRQISRGKRMAGGGQADRRVNCNSNAFGIVGAGEAVVGNMMRISVQT